MSGNKYDFRNFLSICSEKTLQSNQKGFFLQFADSVAEHAGKQWIKSIFGRLKSDKERLKAVYEDPKIKEIVCTTLGHVQEIYRKKSAEVSQARRDDAEKAFQKGDKQKALLYCCQSVLRAPSLDVDKTIDLGKSLAFALWGRCQVLMTMGEFTLALADVQYALKEGLPEHLKAQAFWIMGICYKTMAEENRSKVSFNLAKKLLEDNPKKLSLLEEDMKKTYSQAKKNSRKVLPIVGSKSNKDFPSASGKIVVKDAQGLGRHFVAGEEVNTGETLAVEEPYASCLLPECFGTHCHHCFERLTSPVGCPDCSNVAFCKSECRDIALGSYHKYECKYIDLLIGSGMSILSHTALRMVTQNPLKKILEICKDKSKEHVYKLCTNSHMRAPDDYLQRTLMAAFLLRCLQKAGYFNRNSCEIQPTDEEYAVGELLLYNLQMLQFNAHEIYETKVPHEHRFKKSKCSYIGVAIYPTVSLLNHDCYPGVTRYFVGKNIVINAARPLQPGDVVAENYGPTFTRRLLPDRQKSLAGRYWFKCQCQACTYDWPSLDTGLDKVSRRIRCPNKNCNHLFTLTIPKETTKCPKCKKPSNLGESIDKLKNCEDQYKKAIQLFEEEKPGEGIVILCDAIDSFHKISCPPHRETHLAQEMLRVFFADSGNVFEMPSSNQ